jgi:hypothetical protein
MEYQGEDPISTTLPVGYTSWAQVYETAVQSPAWKDDKPTIRYANYRSWAAWPPVRYEKRYILAQMAEEASAALKTA